MSAGLFALAMLVLSLLVLFVSLATIRHDRRARASALASLDSIGVGAGRIAEHAAEWRRRAEAAEARVAELEAASGEAKK